MKPKLSPTMLSVLAYMRMHGGVIRRYPGGFWARPDWLGRGEFSYATPTLNALQARGEIEWTGLQVRKGGQSSFPVEARIVAKETK